MPFSKPRLLESYADYFIVGGYLERPNQVDIYDRSKVKYLTIDVARELEIALQKRH